MMIKHIVPTLLKLLLLGVFAITSCNALAKPKPNAMTKTPGHSAAPAGDGAEDEEAAPAAPLNPKRKIKPNVVVTQTAVVPPTADGGEPLTPGVVINATTRNETASKETIQLAADGQALLPIVISDKASASTQAVAKDLAEILKRISGASFEVKTSDGSTPAGGIVLGDIKEFPTPSLNKALEIFNGFDGKEAYAIRTTKNRVLLLGATDLGASHAAYRFLREIGYRSFFPDKAWEVVPRIPDLEFVRDITDRPEILARDIWFEAGSGSPQANEDYTNWKRRNSHAQSFVVNAGHILSEIPRAFPEEFKAHPDYYAKNADGTPIWDDIELTNPGVRKLLLEYARHYFTNNPNADMVSFEPVDRGSHSQSAEALKVPYSDQIFSVANEAAKMLQKEFPGKLVGLYSYNAHWDPPTFKLEPNVHVLMSGLGQGKLTPAERVKVWPTRSSNRGIYEYYGVYLWHYDKIANPSGINHVEDMQKGTQSYSATGVTSISAESTSTWGRDGRGYMTANALMWNTHLDLDAFLDDFYDKAFGPGAPAMKRYFERLAHAPFMSKLLLGQAFRDVDEASRLAAKRPDVQARLDFLKHYLRWAHLQWARDVDGKEIPGANAEITELYYRNRHRAIFTYELARQKWFSNLFPQNGGEAANANNAPYTHEETEKAFQEGVNYFPIRTDIGDPVSYSKDLVPINWTAAQKSNVAIVTNKDNEGNEIKDLNGKILGLFQNYQGAVKYALYSVKGEPLEFTTQAGDAWGGINRLSIVDSKGVEIAKEDKIPNKAVTRHTIPVPAPGLYWLDYNDNGSYWIMQTPDGMIATIPLGQTQDYRNMGFIPSQMFFYVPKGTRQIEYYYTRTSFHPGGPHKVLDPTGKVVKDVDVSGDWVVAPVPAGMDGKIWSFQNPVLGIFSFNNLPNYFAPTPSGLLVPREVAEKDGLEVRR